MSLLTTLMETCATLSKKVADLEQDKHTQALKILKAQEEGKEVREEEEVKVFRGCIQAGGKIEAIDADEDITLVDVEKDEEVATMDAELQGRIDQDDEVNVASKGVSAVKPIVFDDKENMTGYKMKHFRGMTYDKVGPIFEREYKKVQTLFKPDKDVEEPIKKRVAKETLLQKSFKKLKAVKISGSESTQETPSNDPKEISKEDVQNMLEIVLVSEVKVKALQVKYPIIDWEIYTEGSRTYWKIIRVGGITEAYQSFEDMLKGFDREDLVALWSLVKEKFSLAVPSVDKEKALWVELKRLFEPDADDVL
nr:hypothetical protein [Tanacetum cinerariifolium]